ncbi:MAG: YCF48-related protein [Bacteroidota bacterium]
MLTPAQGQTQAKKPLADGASRVIMDTAPGVFRSPIHTQLPSTAVAGRSARPAGKVAAPQADVTTIMTETFEGTFPSGLWSVGSGSYEWGKRNCTAHTGSYSAWAVGGGTIGSSLLCGANYPISNTSLMIYGPFDLSDANWAAFNFFFSLNCESNYDYLFYEASIDGLNFYGYAIDGTTNGAWIPTTLCLRAVPTGASTFEDYTGHSQVWIAFGFSSDASVTFAGGAYVDDVLLQKGMVNVPVVLDSFPSPGLSPRGLAFDGTNLWCSETYGQLIYKLSDSGSTISSFASPGTTPTGLAWDGANLWNADLGGAQIYKLSPTGSVLSSFASPGSTPSGLTWDGTGLWNSDIGTDTLWRLSTTGGVLASVTAPGTYHYGMAWDGQSLYLVDVDALLIYRMDPGGNVLDYYSVPGTFPNGLAWDGANFWLSDRSANLIYKLQVVTQQYTNDVGATGMTLPAMLTLGDSLTIVVNVRNFGTAAQTGFPVSYAVNDGPPVTENFSGALAPGITSAKSFTAPWKPTTEGTYHFNAWTSLSGDEFVANDSLPSPAEVIVQPVGFNTPPVLADIGNHFVTAGETKGVPLSATDADSDPLTFSILTNPGFLSITGFSQSGNSATATLQIAPAAGISGSFPASMQVSDGRGGTDIDTFTIEVLAPQPVGNWYLQHPNVPTFSELESVFFLTSQMGWIAGGGEVFHTTNGGRSWLGLPIPDNIYPDAVFFIDSQHGWIVGSECTPYCQGCICRTTDGGTTWSKQVSATWADLRSVWFVDSQHGWVAGGSPKPGNYYDALILNTVDGGNVWMEDTIGGFVSSFLNSLHFVDGQTGWAVGRASYPDDALIFKTTNSGETWTRQTAPVSSPLSSVRFVDNQTGWAVGQSGVVLKTTDGGGLWNTQSSGSTLTLTSLDFTDAQTGWIVGGNLLNQGVILNTVNGGTTWVSKAVSKSLNSIDMNDSQVGYVVGQTGAVFKTTDGGSAWTNLSYSTLERMSGVYFVDPLTGWAGGTMGTFMKTSNAGETWELRNAPNTYRITDMYFADCMTGWACQSGGRILKTTDGGATWSQRTTSTGRTFQAMFFQDARNGWVVGGGTVDRVIYRTTDGGNSWNLQSPPAGTGLMDVFFVNATTGWAIGMYSTILKTTDAGNTWLPQTNGVPTNKWLNGVFFQNSDTGFVVGDGTILKTTDGGSSWVVKCTAGGIVEDVCMLDDLHAWAAGTDAGVAKGIDGNGNIDLSGGNSKFWRSTDGGESWTEDASPAGSWLLGIFFADLNRGWAVGGSGSVLAYHNALLIPEPPSELTADATSMTEIHLTWSDNSTNENGFRIHRSDGISGAYRTVATLAANQESYTDSALSFGTTYWYRVCAFNSTGSSALCRDASATAGNVIAVEETEALPRQFCLRENYPDPFNPSTTIKYDIPWRCYVSLKVYDILGREVMTLVEEFEEAGYKSVVFNAAGLASGVYLYRLMAGDYTKSEKMLLIK